MLKLNKNAVILIYIIFLVNIAVIMAMVIVNNSYVFFNDVERQDIVERTNKNIYDKANSVFKLAKFYNSNWSWFIDNISCPDNILSPLKPITLSWSINKTTTWSTFLDYWNWNINCSWSYLWFDLKIFFNKDFTDFSWSTYSWSYTSLVNWSWQVAFSDWQNTMISFDTTWLNGRDSIDDNFNSDNYLVTSTWTTLSWTYYPNWFADDDVDYRKKFFWYVESWFVNKNIFFNNKETNEVISGSLNNADSLNAKIWTSTWYMMLDVDWTYDLKIVKFSKIKYDEFRKNSPKEWVPIELKVLETIKWKNISSGFWYIYKKTDGDLTTYPYSSSDVPTWWTPYLFDFVNYYYWLFLTNNSNNVLTYNLTAETITWLGIYIVPVDDNSQSDLRFLWNDIYDNFWKYTWYQFSIVWKK